MPVLVVNNLRVNMLRAAEDRKPGTLRRALHTLAHAPVPPQPRLVCIETLNHSSPFVSVCSRCRGSCLAVTSRDVIGTTSLACPGSPYETSSVSACCSSSSLLLLATHFASLASFAPDHFRRVFNALALIGFWLADAANLRRHLADHIFIDPGDAQLRRAFDSKLDARRWIKLNRVGVAHLEDQVIAYFCHAVAHPINLQVLGESLGHARHHICHQRPRQAMQRLVLLALAGAIYHNLPIFHRNLHIRVKRAGQRALWSRHRHGIALPKLDLHPRRHGNWRFDNARHSY